MFFSASAQNNLFHYNVANGLPHDVTYGIFQDREGYIWIGTDDGLVKFDGQNFKLFSTDDGLRTNFIIDIKQDSKGDILLATWGGGLQIIRNDKVIPIKIENDETEKINNLQIWKDNILVKNTSGNIFYKKTKSGYAKLKLRYSNGKKIEYPFSKPFSGYEYASVIDNELFFINDLNFLYNITEINNKGIKANSLFSRNLLYYFKSKTVNTISKLDNSHYIATEKDSIFIFTNHKILRKAKLNIGNQFQYISKIKKHNNQYFFLVTDKKGFKNVLLFSSDFKSKIDFKQKLKISASISDFLIDNEANIWLTTFGDGVYCYNSNEISPKYILPNDIPEQAVFDIKEGNGLHYILTSNYFTELKNFNFFKKSKLSGIGKKITLLDNNQIIIASTGLVKNKINLHFREEQGFNIIDLKQRKKIVVADYIYIEFYDKLFPRNKKNINDAVFYQDTLWFATNVGMHYYDSKRNDLVKKTIANKKLLSDNVRKFLVKNKGLWIATNKGICQLENNKITNYTEENGLINNQINTFILDHNNHFWIATNRGVSFFDEKKFINLNTNRGLLSPFVNVLFEDSKNNIWVGGDKGITVFDNNRLLKLERAPIINVKQNNQIFDYAVLSFNRSKSLIVEYTIDDGKWVSLNEPNGILNFLNLQKGFHSFQIRAKKQDGTWGYSKKYPFKITIPWYKDTLYIIIGILLFSLVVILLILKQLGVVKARNAELKKAIDKQQELEKELKEVRENIAQDFHDDLGNKLARISLLTNMVNSEIATESIKLKAKMEQIENDANYLYKGTKDFIFSLKEESNYLEELVTYLTDFGQDLFSQSNKKFRIVKNIEVNDKLPYYWSKQLIYIFKEAFTNVLKHSNGDTIEFRFIYKNNILEVSCQDNGTIFKDENRKTSGLFNMKKRAEKLNAELTVDFSKNVGTRIGFKGKTT